MKYDIIICVRGMLSRIVRDLKPARDCRTRRDGTTLHDIGNSNAKNLAANSREIDANRQH